MAVNLDGVVRNVKVRYESCTVCVQEYYIVVPGCMGLGVHRHVIVTVDVIDIPENVLIVEMAVNQDGVVGNVKVRYESYTVCVSRSTRLSYRDVWGWVYTDMSL
jgi:hypothetical protein